MGAGLDVQEGASAKSSQEGTPATLVGRNSNGNWMLGRLGMAPLSRQLAASNCGASLNVLGASL